MQSSINFLNKQKLERSVKIQVAQEAIDYGIFLCSSIWGGLKLSQVEI